VLVDERFCEILTFARRIVVPGVEGSQVTIGFRPRQRLLGRKRRHDGCCDAGHGRRGSPALNVSTVVSRQGTPAG
jgi:hypothetical protein